MDTNRTSESKLKNPILKALFLLGGSGTAKKVLEMVEKELHNQLTNYDKETLSSVSQNVRWVKTAHWAKHELVQEGFVSNGKKRGVWLLTVEGSKEIANLIKELPAGMVLTKLGLMPDSLYYSILVFNKVRGEGRSFFEACMEIAESNNILDYKEVINACTLKQDIQLDRLITLIISYTSFKEFLLVRYPKYREIVLNHLIKMN